MTVAGALWVVDPEPGPARAIPEPSLSKDRRERVVCAAWTDHMT